MTVAADLLEAAVQSFDQVGILNTSGANLKTQFQAFLNQASPIYSDADDKDRPIGNWLVPMFALAQQLPNIVSSAPLYQAYDVAWYLYQICITAFYYSPTSAQQTALLAAWNDNIG